MRQFEWKRADGYDRLCLCTKNEAESLVSRYPGQLNVQDFSYQSTYYFLASSKNRIFSPLPGLDYAFEYENEAPYGQEIENDLLPVDVWPLVPFHKTQLPGCAAYMGAIIGELAGIRYKFAKPQKSLCAADFIDEAARFGDETVIVTATAAGLKNALENTGPDWLEDEVQEEYIIACVRNALRYYGDLYPNAGYDGDYLRWLYTYKAKNCSSRQSDVLLRAIPAGWMAKSLEEAQTLGKLVCLASNDNEEAIKACQLVAGVLYILKTTKDRHEARDFADFMTELPQNARQAREMNDSVLSAAAACIWCVLDSTNFSNAIIRAIELHKESDRMAAITGGMAEALYLIPYYLKKKAAGRLSDYLACVLYDAACCAPGAVQVQPQETDRF